MSYIIRNEIWTLKYESPDGLLLAGYAPRVH